MDCELLTLDSWQKVLELYEERFAEYDSQSVHWVFRGCSNSRWELESSLERVYAQLGIPPEERAQREIGMLRRFKRQYVQYGVQLPRDDDALEWLSLMQHHGAPTRLLDFTHSFFVGLYFALEGLPQKDSFSKDDSQKYQHPCLWAINQTEIDGFFAKQNPTIEKYFKKGRNDWTYRTFQRVFRVGPSHRFVRSINPYRLNQRLIVQQGLFLFPGDVTSTFMQNFRALVRPSLREQVCVKIVLDFDLEVWKNALRQLEKMNMTAATLFPGLDGFSKSLRAHMAFKKGIFPPDPEWKSDRNPQTTRSKRSA